MHTHIAEKVNVCCSSPALRSNILKNVCLTKRKTGAAAL